MSFLNMNLNRCILAFGLIMMGSVAVAQETLPVNPGFTPEQAAAMEVQIRQSKSSDVLYPASRVPPAQTRAAVVIDGKSGGRRWCGIGSTPATAMERQLMHYPAAIQQDILDFMFKPNYGMALTHLKVEVGGDNNSTAAVEPSFAHTREELAHPNFHRGGNYWLMRKARDINPGIELGALAWTQPYWVGNGSGRTDNVSFFTQESADYFVKFYEGARKEWGLEMQYFSAEQNERHPGGQREWIVNCLRPAFDQAGFPHVGFVIDNGGWPLRAEDKDPAYLKHIAALGRHYVENSPQHIAPPDIQALGGSALECRRLVAGRRDLAAGDLLCRIGGPRVRRFKGRPVHHVADPRRRPARLPVRDDGPDAGQQALVRVLPALPDGLDHGALQSVRTDGMADRGWRMRGAVRRDQFRL
jgi:hypothetical protein